jgi:PAS domain-containing protein
LNDSAQGLFKTDPDHPIVGSSITKYISLSSQTPLLKQFERIHSGDATAIGLTIEMSLGSNDDLEFIALNSPIEWNGCEQIQVLHFETDEALPTGLSARTMDASPIGITIDDATLDDEQVVYVNDGFCELTGYEREEILGRNCRLLQGEETDETTVAEIRQAIDAEEPITAELRNYRVPRGISG